MILKTHPGSRVLITYTANNKMCRCLYLRAKVEKDYSLREAQEAGEGWTGSISPQIFQERTSGAR